ncbi:MAG: histidine phosphatase family protein [Myxococcota bacterium]
MSTRRLILMRHATAARGTGRDFDRPLTDDGRDEARRVGERLRALEQAPTHVLSSSARRCQETWDAVAAGLGAAGPADAAVDRSDALYDASAGELFESIRDWRDATEGTLLVLAHNPGISLLALELGRGDERDALRLRDGFAPATVAVFAVACPWSGLIPGSIRLLRFERAPRAPEKTE